MYAYKRARSCIFHDFRTPELTHEFRVHIIRVLCAPRYKGAIVVRDSRERDLAHDTRDLHPKQKLVIVVDEGSDWRVGKIEAGTRKQNAGCARVDSFAAISFIYQKWQVQY